MGNNFQFLEIIFFAMVAIFILLRLKNVLGRRTGNEPTNQNRFKKHENENTSEISNVVKLGEKTFNESKSPSEDKNQTITEIDPNYDEEEFLNGASTAYEMILTSFANADFDTLRVLLDDDVYNDFYNAIEERNDKGQQLETTIVSINTKEIIDTSVKDDFLELTVKFSSEIINVLRDKQGNLLSKGNPVADNVIDIWTFSRDTRSNDLNWKLIATLSEN